MNALPADVWVEEGVYQAIHVLDLQQTLDIKHFSKPCVGVGCPHYYFITESENIFDLGWIVGSRPSDRAIYTAMGTRAVLHGAITLALNEWAPKWATRVWEITTISVDGLTVRHNHEIGLRVHF